MLTCLGYDLVRNRISKEEIKSKFKAFEESVKTGCDLEQALSQEGGRAVK